MISDPRFVEYFDYYYEAVENGYKKSINIDYKIGPSFVYSLITR